MQGICLVFPDDQVQHDIRTGLGDGTAITGKRSVLDDPCIIDQQMQGDLVPAAGIDAAQRQVGIWQLMLMGRMMMVVHSCFGGLGVSSGNSYTGASVST